MLCTPVIRALHQQRDAEIHLLTKAKFADVLKDNPHIAKIYSIEQKVEEVISALKAEKYDYIIDLHKNLRSFKTRSLLGLKVYSFNKLSVERTLYAKWKWDVLPDDVSIVDRMFEGLKDLGIKNDGSGLDFYSHTYRPYEYHFMNYAVLALGATYPTKRMTSEILMTFIEHIDRPIYIIGGKDTMELADTLSWDKDRPIINLVGKTDLAQSAHIVQEARYVVTGDSAIMHIAAAKKTPMIVAWGCTSPKFGFFPYYGAKSSDAVYLEKSLDCRPCSKQGEVKCPLGHYDCMKHSKEDIINSIATMESYDPWINGS